MQEYMSARMINVLAHVNSICKEQSGKELKLCVPIEYMNDIYYGRMTFSSVDITLTETLQKMAQLSHLQFELDGETVIVSRNPDKERPEPISDSCRICRKGPEHALFGSKTPAFGLRMIGVVLSQKTNMGIEASGLCASLRQFEGIRPSCRVSMAIRLSGARRSGRRCP
jgi:hypothetical protein